MSSSGEDVLIDGSKSVIVVADTHLGVKDNVTSRPLILSSFLKWVKGLEEGPSSVNLGKWGEGSETKTLRLPQLLILLGDILELWDATDRSVDACSRFVFGSMAEMQSTKVYVLGNHDYDLVELIWKDRPRRTKRLKDIERGYPLSRSRLRFFDEVYPPQPEPNLESGRPPIRTLRSGDDRYLFLHGHQFDALFTLPSWRWMPSIRKAALVFGSFTWVFVALFLSDLILTISTRAIDLHGLVLLASLACISVPFLLIQFGRKVWNKVRTRKYDRRGGLEGFVRWWKGYSKDYDSTEHNLNVVYGHTHLTDVVHSPDEIRNILGVETSFRGRLLNLPAWSKDLSEEREEVLQAVFLYIDEEGSWFFGWDWEKQTPFLIPKPLIKERRERKIVVKDDETAENLEAIGWPTPLIDEWRNKSTV